VDAARIAAAEICPSRSTTTGRDDADTPFAARAGAEARIEFDFHALLPKVFARTGFWDTDFFMVGSGSPRSRATTIRAAFVAVPRQRRVLADFGTYDVDITVPKNFVLGATGTWCIRKSKETPRPDVSREDVIDFAWTASPHYKTATRRAGDVTSRCSTSRKIKKRRAVPQGDRAVAPGLRRVYGPYPTAHHGGGSAVQGSGAGGWNIHADHGWRRRDGLPELPAKWCAS